MTVDLRTALRRRKPEKQLTRLKLRSPAVSSPAGDAPPGRVALVPDTNVYIANAAGTLPPDAEALFDRALLFHCTVSLAELSTGIANGDPRHARWASTRDHYSAIMAAIPDTRILVPDRGIWLDAGVLAGTLARTQGFQPFQRKDLLNDALIFLTAARVGLPVLTSNRVDFDLLQQLAPEGRFYHF